MAVLFDLLKTSAHSAEFCDDIPALKEARGALLGGIHEILNLRRACMPLDLIPPAPFSWEEKGGRGIKDLKSFFWGERKSAQRLSLFSPSLFKRRGRGMSSAFLSNQTKKAHADMTADSAKAKPAPHTILFFGNSLTAGYGLDPSAAFPALIQQKIEALKLPYQTLNAGLSGETSAGGLRRIDWLLHRKVDILVLELGANDGLRGIALADTRKNLQEIIARTKKKYPHARLVIAGMRVPPNLGQEYSQQFRRLFVELARENKAALIPFLLEGVGGVPELNLPDGIHPTAQGHEKVAANVWRVLLPLLQRKEGQKL